MLYVESLLSCPPGAATQFPLSEPSSAQPASTPNSAPDPEPEIVRHLIYGSPRAIQHTLNQLRALGYAEHFLWNPIAPIPETGIHITQEQAEAYTFLTRELRLGA